MTKRLISSTEAAKAIQWLEQFMQGTSPDAVQARLVNAIIQGMMKKMDEMARNRLD